MEVDQTNGELLVASDANLRAGENWILDSGCTFHMTPNRDWFSTYEPVHKGAVLMGNDAFYNVAGIRRVRIKMFVHKVLLMQKGTSTLVNVEF